MDKKEIRRIIKTIGLIIGGVVILGAVFYSGFTTGNKQASALSNLTIENGEAPAELNETIDLKTFWEAWQVIRSRHIDGEEIDSKKLLDGAVAGLVGALDDPYSIWLKPDDSQKFQEDVRGNFGGVGMRLETKNGLVTVLTPLDGTPASRAGIKAGDIILAVDGKELEDNDWDIYDAIKEIRGEIGEAVTLTIIREGWSEPKDIEIVRDEIEIPTLEWGMRGDNDIAYVKLLSFNENSLSLFYEAILKSLFNGAEGLVLDLRNNPGGYLEVATRMAGWFVENGEVVVSEQLRTGEVRNFYAQGNEALKDFPVVVVVNQGSASASEILAGALRDIRGVQLIGETTFGKGTVQELENLSDGSTIKVTVARWVMPSGQILRNEGLEPDVEVEITEEERQAGKDPQLDKAIEIIKTMI